MPRIPLKTSSTLDNPQKYTECLKTYKHQKDLNRHIRSMHDFVTYTCMESFKSYTQHQQEYKIPKHPTPSNMPWYIGAKALSANQGSSTKTCLSATVTPSNVVPGEAMSKGPKLKTTACKQSQVMSPLRIKLKLPKIVQCKTVTIASTPMPPTTSSVLVNITSFYGDDTKGLFYPSQRTAGI